MGKIYKDGNLYGVSDFDDVTNRPLESDAINIDDLDLPMPAKPTEYPVLFDETGTEYQIGLYKRASDGKVKPVWRKDLYYNQVLSGTVDITQGLPSNIDIITDIEATGYRDNIGAYFKINRPAEDTAYTTNIWYLVENNTPKISITISSRWGNQVTKARISLYYTKTTDEFRDL